jgi:hypothetical protein
MFQIRQILSSVQGSDGPSRVLVENRKMELVDVEMHDIEFRGHPANFVEHQHVVGDDIDNGRVHPQWLRATGHELCRCDRLPAREQSHIMALGYQFLRQVGGDSFGTAIEPWRYAFHQGCNLRNFHAEFLMLSIGLRVNCPSRIGASRREISVWLRELSFLVR